MNNTFKIEIAGEEVTVKYTDSIDIAYDWIQAIIVDSHHTLGLDIETGKLSDDKEAGLDPYKSFISLIQLYDPLNKIVYMFDVINSGNLCIESISGILQRKRLVAHFAIFDQLHLAHAGYPDLKIDCTNIMYNIVRCAEYADIEEEELSLQEEGTGDVIDLLTKKERYGASLSAVTAKVLDIYIDKDLQTSNWNHRPLTQEQLMYAAKDAYFTLEIGKILSKKIQDLGLSKVYRLYRDAIHPVVHMQLTGITINKESHADNISNWTAASESSYSSLKEIVGEINVNSTAQLHHWIHDHLSDKGKEEWPRSEKTGKFKTDAKTLVEYQDKKFPKALLEYKKSTKLLSTYGQPLLDRINTITNRLHGGYTIGFTATGRLSSRAPNLQNMPHTSEMRRIFTASPDSNFLLIGADYNQIEVRVAAELSRDPLLLNIFKEGKDVYTVTAAKVMGRQESSIAKDSTERKLGKVLVLGLLYGLGAKKLVEYAKFMHGVKLTLDEAYIYHRLFFETYHGYADWQERMRADAEETEISYTQLGKGRRLKKGFTYTKSVNHPVQGTAAEIILLALNNLYSCKDVYQYDILLCVHDEIVLEIKNKAYGLPATVLKEKMEQAMQMIFPNASLNKLVAVKTGSTWAELK